MCSFALNPLTKIHCSEKVINKMLHSLDDAVIIFHSFLLFIFILAGIKMADHVFHPPHPAELCLFFCVNIFEMIFIHLLPDVDDCCFY